MGSPGVGHPPEWVGSPLLATVCSAPALGTVSSEQGTGGGGDLEQEEMYHIADRGLGCRWCMGSLRAPSLPGFSLLSGDKGKDLQEQLELRQ